MKLSWQPGLICAMGFIMHICWIVLGPLGGGAVDWNFEKLKIAILASGLVYIYIFISYIPFLAAGSSSDENRLTTST